MNIESMCNSIAEAMESSRNAIANVPALLLSLSTINRPGLSVTEITSKIISRQQEAGAPYGPAEDGSQSIDEAMERIRIEEIINAIKLTSRVQVSIPIGGIEFIGFGANEGGPMVVKGMNSNFVHGDGIVG